MYRISFEIFIHQLKLLIKKIVANYSLQCLCCKNYFYYRSSISIRVVKIKLSLGQAITSWQKLSRRNRKVNWCTRWGLESSKWRIALMVHMHYSDYTHKLVHVHQQVNWKCTQTCHGSLVLVNFQYFLIQFQISGLFYKGIFLLL